MQKQNTFYPVRIVSRSIAKKRMRRVSWFVLGTSFGVGWALMMTSVLTPSTWFSSSAPQTASISAPAPETEHAAVQDGINVVAAPIVPKEPKQLVENDKKPPAVYPLVLALKVEDGDTLINILTDTGVSYDEANNAVNAVKTVYNPHRLDIGQSIDIVLDKLSDDASPVITSLRIPTSSTSVVVASRSQTAKNGDFDVKKIDTPVETKLAHAGGRIDSSLYETGVAQGIPVSLLSEIISAYSYDVDFQRDIQPGDAIDVLYERIQTKEGVTAGHGNILFAQLDLGGKPLKIYRYTDKTGFTDFYNEKGESLRKALLRTPVNGAKITSGFGMRNHPILGYTKMHRGVDFGAPTGTPIYAAGDGTVEFVGRKGGYGNYMRIRHNGKYASAYAHISRFASGMATGHHVKQGQIIAYVGATGMATGPHLHYEILVNNEQVNPSSVKFKAGNVLQGKELTSFHKNMEQIQAQVANTPRKTDVAMAVSSKNEVQVAEAKVSKLED